jgi:two-component system, OmpR family, sensor histidine kinase CpxA
MRSLFAKIFLSFFLTVLVVGGLIVVTTMARLPDVTDEVRTLLAREAARAADSYERGGAPALADVLAEFPAATMVDAQGHPLAAVPAELGDAAAAGARFMKSDEPKTGLRAWRGVGYQPITSSGGRSYLLVVRLPRERAMVILGMLELFPGMRLAIVALVAGLICFLLARHITTPLVRLRAAAGRMAEGRLDQRAGPGLSRRRDEIGALGRDFDRMAERIEALVASERRLLADVSHELRSPLARLTVAVGLARQRHGRSVIPELDRIEREVQCLDTLIGQSLTLARIEGGMDAGRRETFSLTDLVQEVAADGDFEARAAGRSVRTLVLDACVVSGVPELVRSAIENVVRNAIRFTAPGTSVDLELRGAAGGSGATARVRVRDHGPGIPDTLLRDVFLPFRRAGDERRPEGAGLGLAITARVVRMHGGTVRAVNADDGGLVVELTLPLTG